MIFVKKTADTMIGADGEKIENVKQFVYLSSLLTWDNDCTMDVKVRIMKGKVVLAGFNQIQKAN